MAFQIPREAVRLRLAVIPGKQDTAGWPSRVFATQHGKDMVFQAAKERVSDPDSPGEVPSDERPSKRVTGK